MKSRSVSELQAICIWSAQYLEVDGFNAETASHPSRAVWAQLGSNQRPPDYESGALTR